ncbi:YybS family protein [Pallidibacillus pasinlerensis]|uniref:YybS family protein n=1 Tax=Pallidibacillus pasinlerensis TaxID=2703818 RepID=A0ABX0A3R4_9BACI|nr:YybS family protein [Pallidibacillus pasinlerensis]NCU17169.1 YybS family protein [Pallidibacillus pasinlerensis]
MQTNKLTEGAILLAVYGVLLFIFLYLPFLWLIVAFVLALPFTYFTAKYDLKHGLFFFVGSLILTLIIGNIVDIVALPVTILYGMVGIVFGWCLLGRKDRFITFSATTLTFLACTVLLYIGAILLFDMNFIQETIEMSENAFQQYISVLESTGQDVSLIKETLPLIKQQLITLIPSMFILASGVIVLFIQTISYPILKRFGFSVPEASQFRNLTLPRSLIWYYLITVLISLFVKADEGTFLFNAIANILFVLQFLFVIQGISFLFFLSYEKGVKKVWPIIGTILVIISPLFNTLARIIGIVDIGFGLRQWIRKKS